MVNVETVVAVEIYNFSRKFQIRFTTVRFGNLNNFLRNICIKVYFALYTYGLVRYYATVHKCLEI